MANKISPEVRNAILREFSQPGNTKAGIARKYSVSPSTVSRIIAAPTLNGKSEGAEKQKPSENGLIGKFSREGISEADLAKLLAFLKENADFTSLGELFADFMGWIRERDELEKNKLLISTEIESLKSRREMIEREISELEGKTAKLEINIWRMRSVAERAHDSMARVEERMDILEDRMMGNRDLLILAAGLKSMLENGDIGEEAMTYISDPESTWGQNNQDAVERIREVLKGYLRDAASRFPGEE